jgi:glycerophosphoryl diester phosphodiesterase
MALAAARREGLGAELDVQISADGTPVVFHDASLERMTDASGLVRTRTAAALSELRLRDQTSRIPTLAEALAVAGRRLPLLVELKSPPGEEGPLERAVCAALDAHPGPTAVISFNPQSLVRVRAQRPHLALGLLIDGWRVLTRQPSALVFDFLADSHVRPDFLACGLDALRTHGRPAAARLGAPLLAWTVRSPAQLTYAQRFADQVIFEHVPPRLVRR